MGIASSKTLSTTLHNCTLWKVDRSPACRSVMMALDAMNLSLTEVDVDIDKDEHNLPEIVAMNPFKTLPILKDRELILRDSHAINSYLALRYDESDKILPQDPAGRSLVDQMLHYDSGILQPRYYVSVYPILYENCRYVMPQPIEDIEKSYQDLETMLTGHSWFSGSWLTLGDITAAATVSTTNVLVPIDKQRFPLLSNWLYRMSEQSFFVTANKKGLNEFTNRIDTGKISGLNEFKKCPRSSLTRRSTGGTYSET
ncbi:glutathione S-transferase 1-like [Nymphalis io]|uniref:glutathione S-transferase 1-like n=1 Tax=Inachis io TaxID=171585 RepID=UPI002168B46F|nr:glutathione S-transferase 1-like [Nymphalis io]